MKRTNLRQWYWGLRRFGRALRPRLTVEDYRLLAVLSPSEQAFFFRLAPMDQRHSLDVARELALGDQGLVRLGLLHDLGKIEVAPGLWGRVLVAFGYRGARVRDYLRHPDRGVDIGRSLGLEEQVLEGIGHHHDRVVSPLTEMLQRADAKW